MQRLSSALDKYFLEQEPLLSLFGALEFDPGHTRTSRDDRFRHIAKELKESNWGKNVQLWLDLAIPPQRPSKLKGIVVDDSTWLLFVKFQWALKKNGTEAEKLLSGLRKGKGCTSMPCYRPELATPPIRKRHLGRRYEPEVIESNKSTGRSKKRRRKAKGTVRHALPNPTVVDSVAFEEAAVPGALPTSHVEPASREEGFKMTEPLKTIVDEQTPIVDSMVIDFQPCFSHQGQSGITTGVVEVTLQLEGRSSSSLYDNTHYEQDAVRVGTPSRPRSSVSLVRGDSLSSLSSLDSPVSFRANAIAPIPDIEQTSSISPYNGTGSEPHMAVDSIPKVQNKSTTSVSLYPRFCYPVRPFDAVNYYAPLPNTYKLEDEVPRNWLCEISDTVVVPYNDVEEEMETDPSLLDDSERVILINRPKAPLPAHPPIWAQSRQEVCESFGWFRSYQGGVYFSREIVKGYLLGGFSASRDRFEHDGKLIISHGGGKAACTLQQKRQSIVTAEDDQLAQDRSVRALLRTYRECRPIVLIIDERYALFPFDLASKEVSYAVLGFYTIAHAWAEYQPAQNEQGRVVRYKFAFRWCEGQGEPWWIQATEPSIPPPNSKSPLRRMPVKIMEQAITGIKPPVPSHLYLNCYRCCEWSPRVYSQGWACLNPECRFFWFTGNYRRLPDRLDYNPEFLQLTQPFVVNEALVKGLKPSVPVSSPGNGIMTSYASTRGWHCNRCGRLSCRYKWEKYECAHCHLSLNVLGQIRSPNVLRSLHVPVPFQDHYYSKVSEVTFVGVSYFDFEGSHRLGLCQTFKLPYERGFIHHIKDVSSDFQPEANQVFREYQEQALAGMLPFRRWPLRSHKCRGLLLTNYFSQNCGAPYQYVGGTANTLPWDKAPGAVIDALNLIESRVSKALNRSVQFNEVLSAAYMERQRMAFHSDGEPGLGPLVAGLSLGSPALMHFRLLAKYDPIREQRQIALTFVLRHGDILVMDGANVQKYYEHTVVPSNFRIAATARFIDKEHAISKKPDSPT
ncbi:hypothetical protein AX15_003465 [Amanita polypyramis BW_CC]|nr:hypothetical protein AX15_003465 [Amanita polypyramis BW_CC]